METETISWSDAKEWYRASSEEKQKEVQAYYACKYPNFHDVKRDFEDEIKEFVYFQKSENN